MEQHDLLSADDLSRHYSIEVAFILELKERNLIELVTMEDKIYLNIANLRDLEKLIRLHFELDINLEGIEAIHHLLHRVTLLQRQVAEANHKLRNYEN